MCGDKIDEGILGAVRYNRMWDRWVETGDIEELLDLAICLSYEGEPTFSDIPIRWLMVMKLHGVINL